MDSLRPIPREKREHTGPCVTENGNFILDLALGITDNSVGQEIKSENVSGVIETGLFNGYGSSSLYGN